MQFRNSAFSELDVLNICSPQWSQFLPSPCHFWPSPLLHAQHTSAWEGYDDGDIKMTMLWRMMMTIDEYDKWSYFERILSVCNSIFIHPTQNLMIKEQGRGQTVRWGGDEVSGETRQCGECDFITRGSNEGFIMSTSTSKGKVVRLGIFCNKNFSFFATKIHYPH